MTAAHVRRVLIEARDIGFAEFVAEPYRVTIWDDPNAGIRWRIEGHASKVGFAEGGSAHWNPSIAAAAAALAELTGDGCAELAEALPDKERE